MQETPFTVSYEIRGPERGNALSGYFRNLKTLMGFKPAFVSIANHQPDKNYGIDKDGGAKKIVQDKYSSTYFFALALRDRFEVEVIPHLLCNELAPDSIDDILIGFNYAGIKKVMALRGDRISNTIKFPNTYSFSSDLIKHIVSFNSVNGTHFKIGVGGYPNTHPTAISTEHDIWVLKNKIELGAAFITTQMFLDNACFYDYLSRCRLTGIFSPIYPGLKLIQQPSNIVQYKHRFKLTIPDDLETMFSRSHVNDYAQYGEQWLFEQCKDLINNHQKHLHFYIFSAADITGVSTVINRLHKHFTDK